MGSNIPTVPDEIKNQAKNLTVLRTGVFSLYSALVDSIVQEQIVDVSEIECIMDELLDFCDEDRFISLYKKLCRHIYGRHPDLVGEHVSMFLSQFLDSENNEIGGHQNEL